MLLLLLPPLRMRPRPPAINGSMKSMAAGSESRLQAQRLRNTLTLAHTLTAGCHTLKLGTLTRARKRELSPY